MDLYAHSITHHNDGDDVDDVTHHRDPDDASSITAMIGHGDNIIVHVELRLLGCVDGPQLSLLAVWRCIQSHGRINVWKHTDNGVAQIRRSDSNQCAHVSLHSYRNELRAECARNREKHMYT